MATDAVLKAMDYRRKERVPAPNSPVSYLIDPVIEKATGASPPLASSASQLSPVVHEPVVEKKLPTTNDIKTIIKTDPTVRKAVVEQYAQVSGKKLTAKQAAQSEELLQDEVKLVKKNEQSNPGISAAFTTALLGFLPTLVGAAFGGDEGGAAGAEMGVRAMGQYGEAVKDEQKQALDVKKQELESLKERNANVRFDIEEERKGKEADIDRLYKMGVLANQAYANKLDAMQAEAASTGNNQKLTEAQTKARTLGAVAESQLVMYDKVSSENDSEYFNIDSKLASVGLVLDRFVPHELGMVTVPDNLKAEIEAGNGLAEAVLRDETGAAMADTEFKRKKGLIVNRRGDTSEQRVQKSINRHLIVNAMKEKGRLGFKGGELEDILKSSNAVYKITSDVQKGVPLDQALRGRSLEEVKAYTNLKLRSGR